MRFDDMAATVIAKADAGNDTRVIAWQQLVDLAAQKRTDDARGDAIYPVLRAWRASVPTDRRRQVADSLIGRPIPPHLFAFFAEDDIAVVQGLVRTVRFSDEQWTDLLPSVPPAIRALLRHRGDLGASAERVLALFGAADRLISAPTGEQVERPVGVDPASEGMRRGPASPEPGQVSDLMSRIETFRKHRGSPVASNSVVAMHGTFTTPCDEIVRPDADSVVDGESVDHFRFETGRDGIVIWVEGAPRAPLVGISIATPGDSAEHGVDGYAAGAFRRRAPFRDARLSVPGGGVVNGDWRISALPFFGPRDGRFMGYRGTARRPRADEVARREATAGLYGSALRPESLRQLVHELRTPLNAILGFAEMIDGQILGPAARDYREKALEIVSEARKLLSVVDDLDTAARVDSNALRLQYARMDGASMLDRIVDDLQSLARERGVVVTLEVNPEAPELSVDPLALERMFSRLLSTVIAVSALGEVLTIRFDADGQGRGALVVDRPEALRAMNDRDLLDPAYNPEGEWPDAPLLGLGFALRFVRNLAEAAGGRFAITPTRFELTLPAVRAALLSEGG